MRLIDSHLHVWDPGMFDYAWLEGVPQINKRFGPEELAADFAPAPDDRVEYVFVQADCDPSQSLAEVEWVSSVAAEGAIDIRGIVAHAPLERGADVEADIALLMEHELVVGVRRLLQSEATGFAVQPGFVDGARALASVGLSFDAGVTHSLIPDVAELADAVPDLTIVLDHLGKPDILTGDFDAWRRRLIALAERPNVWCKLSGLPSLVTEEWTPNDFIPYLDAAVSAFGADRCLFGSDWPASSPQSSFTRWVQFVRAWAGTLSESESDGILWRNAERAYRLAG